MSDKNAIHNDKKPINVFISYKRDDNLYNHLVRIVKKTFFLAQFRQKVLSRNELLCQRISGHRLHRLRRKVDGQSRKRHHGFRHVLSFRNS